MLSTKSNKESKFEFTPLKHIHQGYSNIKDSLFKWGLDSNSTIQRFTFDQKLSLQDLNVFHSDLLKIIKPTLNIQNVQFERLQVTATSLDFFNNLTSCRDIISQNKDIKGCFDEYIDNLLISDELRKVLVNHDSKNYNLFSSSHRSEFMFHIFKQLCIGGNVCQFEDSVDVYLEATRSLYKDLVSVLRNSDGSLKPISFVFKIHGLFDGDLRNFCFASVNGVDGIGYQTVDVWCHASDVYF